MYKRIINRLLKRLELKRVATENKVVFLTLIIKQLFFVVVILLKKILIYFH